MFVLVRFFILIDMLTFDNKFNIGSEVSANDMAVTFVVVAIFPRLLDNGSQYISYLCAPKESGERFWYFREEELFPASRPAHQVNIVVTQKSLFD